MDPIAAAAMAGLAMGVGLGILAAFAFTLAIWIAWISLRARGPDRSRNLLRGFPLVAVIVPALVFSVPAGCAGVFFFPRPQPASLKTVAAVEVPLRTSADHADLLAMLQRVARQQGLHVDDGTKQWIQFRRSASPNEPVVADDVLTKTIYATAYRGSDDSDLEIDVDDGGHQGRAWLTFIRGEHPDLAARTRVQLIADIRRRWSDARSIPVMPNGALPLATDLTWTGTSYVVKPDRLATYGRTTG
jgi:hypothetical protein